MDGSIRSNEIRRANTQPQTLTQDPNHGQVEAAGEKGPHPRIREEGHGVDTEPRESRLQQDLPEDDVQPLVPVQVRQNMIPAPAGLFPYSGSVGIIRCNLVYILGLAGLGVDKEKAPQPLRL